MPNRNSEQTTAGNNNRLARQQGGMGGHAGATESEFASEDNVQLKDKNQQSQPDSSQGS